MLVKWLLDNEPIIIYEIDGMRARKKRISQNLIWITVVNSYDSREKEQQGKGIQTTFSYFNAILYICLKHFVNRKTCDGSFFSLHFHATSRITAKLHTFNLIDEG